MGLANSLCDKADVEVVHPKRIESVCNTLADPRVRVRSFEKPKVAPRSTESAGDLGGIPPDKGVQARRTACPGNL